MNKLIFFAALIVLFFSSCGDDNDESTNKILLSYKASGSLVEVTASNGGASAMVDATGTVLLTSAQLGGNGLTIGIESNKVGKYILGEVFGINYGSYQSLLKAYTTEKTNDGVVEITESTSTNLKGTFKFTGYDFDGNKIEITDGVFDVPVRK
jgi:hypothetical protein